MKAIVFTKPYKVELREVGTPKIGSNDVLTETIVTGIGGGTERGIFRGVFPRIVKGERTYPMIPGFPHSIGIVKEVGKKVKKFKPGDRVIAGGATYGIKNYTLYWGGHVEYKKSLESEVYKIPEGIPFEVAVLSALGGDAVDGIKNADIEFGDTVVIIGQGIVGQFMSQLAKVGGAGKVIAVDLFEFKLDLSKKLGADCVINAKEDDPVKKVLEITDGNGADVVLEVTGKGESVNQAFKMARKKGKIVAFGRHLKPEEIDLTSDFWYKKQTLKGSFASEAMLYRDLFFSLASTGRIDVKGLVTHEFPIEKVKEAYDVLDSEKHLQIIFRWK